MVKSWPQAPALHCTFTPLLLFSRKQGEFPGEKGVRAFCQTSVSVFGEEEMVERGQRECPEVQRNLSLATVVKRAKLLRTENCKLADVYWLLFFLILPDSFLALKVQTLHQRA